MSDHLEAADEDAEAWAASRGTESGVHAPAPREPAWEASPPPSDHDAERSVLASWLVLGTERRASIALDRALFFTGSHQRVFDAASWVVARGEEPSLPVVAARLRDTGRFEEVGGFPGLSSLLESELLNDPSPLVRRLEELQRRRALLAAGEELAARARVGSEPVAALLERAQAALAGVAASAEAKRGPFDGHGLAAIGKPLPPIPWLVEGLGVAPGAPIVLVGYGYSRKTMAAQSLALSVAAGTSVFGVWRARRGRVLHLDYEQGERVTYERYQRLARGMGFELRDLADDAALRVEALPRMYLDERGAETQLSRAAEGCALVVVDSLAACSPGLEENSSEKRQILDALLRVSGRTGAAVLLIHHAGKAKPEGGGKQAGRGSSAIFDGAGGWFVFEGEKGAPTKVVHEKERNRGVTSEDFGINAEDIPDSSGKNPNYGLRVVHLSREQLALEGGSEGSVQRLEAVCQRVLDVVRSVPGSGKKELRALAGRRFVDVDAAIDRLVNTKRIVNRGSRSDQEYHAVV